MRLYQGSALALSLAALEIGLKEAPQRGWSSPVCVSLFGLCLLCGMIFVRRSLRATPPIVRLATLGDRRFAVGCVLSFLTGIGLYGTV